MSVSLLREGQWLALEAQEEDCVKQISSAFLNPKRGNNGRLARLIRPHLHFSPSSGGVTFSSRADSVESFTSGGLGP